MMAIYNDELVLVLRWDGARARIRRQNGQELTVSLNMLEVEPANA